ncbi:MAG TPA: hypothetical protein VHC22_28585 [Pirellulales bacterium]|nr:hypothetical protein [Pirellulales bacterium]
MRRFQFTLKTLLWLMVVVGAFLAGAEWQRRKWATERRFLLDRARGGQYQTAEGAAEQDRSPLHYP